MADLRLIKELHQKYRGTSPFHAVDFDEQQNVTEAFDPDRIQKALGNKVAELGPAYTMYFDLGVPADIALLFIDICSFSERNENFSDQEMVKFLDGYYDIVLPIIQQFGGEVDKIMGDGIICLFGPPFLEDEVEMNLFWAHKCATEIIRKTNKTQYKSKIAFHSGQIRYYKNSSIHYHEYTIVGKLMTELFRLESISEDGEINFYSDSIVAKSLEEKLSDNWKLSGQKIIAPKLKGVDYEYFRTLKYSG